MRCTMLFVVICSLFCCPLSSVAAPVRPDTASHIYKLQQTLAHYASVDSQVTKWSKAVNARFPVYYKWASEAQRIGRGGVNRVDIILQRHEIPNQTTEQELRMHYSQLRIRQLLDSLNCRVIGIENTDLERLTWPALVNVVVAEHQDYYGHGVTIDTTYCQLLVLRAIWKMNGLAFFEKHPNANMLGAEDMPLHRLQVAVMRYQAWRRYYLMPPDPNLDTLFWALVRARSELAVIKTLRVMAKYSQVHGAVVIGLSHEPEQAEIAQRYRLRSTIYWTEVPDRLPTNWWK